MQRHQHTPTTAPFGGRSGAPARRIYVQVQTFSQLIEIKRWADRGLCEVIVENHARLSAEEQVLMRRILDHIHAVDRIFRSHLLGQPHSFSAPRSAELPELRSLAAGIRVVDDWYASYVHGLAEEEFAQPLELKFTSGKQQRMRRSDVLMHVCLHGTYHRGNAGAVLQLKGITPSRDAVTDYFEYAA
jgi:uncharacterized damage-inducible protein DinB